ncbi:hypothetical protein [Magnetococcus marinus]|uniref:hypothetical protein n=1 Tax=Magnetococcus marinus TaxID=1124597 RepID=UPI00117FF5A6|nr:hypothetical protein [Magnetococcus marinus]
MNTDWLKNISVNIRATGPAAVIIVWIIAVTVLGIWGEGGHASYAQGMLNFCGGIILVVLAKKT